MTSSRQTTSGKTFNFLYTYNKAGMVASQTYPSGRVISNCYNSGGQEKSVSGLMSGVPHTYAASTTYGSHGGAEGSGGGAVVSGVAGV